MPQRLNLPSTKSSLLLLRRRAVFLRQGYQLLERKQELLTRLVYAQLREYRRLRREVRAALPEVYRWLGLASLRLGSYPLRQLVLGLAPAVAVEIHPKHSLGVEYPAVTARLLSLPPLGLLGTDVSLDEARRALAQLVVVLARLGEAELALWRLLEAERKTQKRVNALRYNIIPRYETSIRYIQAALEEEERNVLFQVRRLTEKGNGYWTNPGG
jgi:V/A-type H+-transporting ATPase subunit D